jgi:hypothetical protein
MPSSSSSSSAHRMLWDRFPRLPYHARAPWPSTVVVGAHNNDSDGDPNNNNTTPIITVETWLHTHVGAHYVDWTWDMWHLQSPYHNWCGVSFLHQRSVTLFLLRFGA